MTRAPAALIAAVLATQLALPAARAFAQAAAPFPEVALPPPPKSSHKLAYVSMIAGAGLIAASFPLKDEADQAYEDYLIATDPEDIDEFYDRSRRYDVLSGVSLVGGEVLLALGIYLRFMREPARSRFSLTAEAGRCGLSLRF
jgi:hypothetical protein